jgi:hypothetical protein
MKFRFLLLVVLLLVLSSTSGVISSLLCDNGDDERRGGKTRTGVVKREKSKNVKGAVAKTNQLPFYIFTLFTLHSFLSSTGEVISSLVYIDTIMEMERVEKGPT